MIIFKDKQGYTIDSVLYSNQWGGRSGVSLERIDPQSASNDPTNWGSSIDNELGHSAGRENSLFKEDSVIPQLEFVFYYNKRLKIKFNKFINASTLDGVFLIQNTSRMILSIDTMGVFNEFHLPLTRDIGVESTSIRISIIEDVKGNRAEDISFPVSFFPKFGDVIFNEIMYDPIDSETDGFANQPEYIEIFNRANYAISLESILLYTGRNEEDTYI